MTGAGHRASVVFAAAVPPYLPKTDDSPRGSLDDEAARSFEDGHHLGP